jgi:hypothetical protein
VRERAGWEVDWGGEMGKKERAEMWAVGEMERWVAGLPGGFESRWGFLFPFLFFFSKLHPNLFEFK